MPPPEELDEAAGACGGLGLPMKPPSFLAWNLERSPPKSPPLLFLCLGPPPEGEGAGPPVKVAERRWPRLALCCPGSAGAGGGPLASFFAPLTSVVTPVIFPANLTAAIAASPAATALSPVPMPGSPTRPLKASTIRFKVSTKTSNEEIPPPEVRRSVRAPATLVRRSTNLSAKSPENAPISFSSAGRSSSRSCLKSGPRFLFLPSLKIVLIREPSRRPNS